MKENVISKLTSRDDKFSCAFADKIMAESGETDKWYEYLPDFAALLNHPKSLVRNRAIHILAANARWDTENHFDAILPALLSHVEDEKPITARQCIKALVPIGQAKPQYISRMLVSLREAELSRYKDSMRPLIEKDRAETEKALIALTR